MTSVTQLVERLYEPSERSWARLVSDIFSPPLVWMALIVPMALKYTSNTSEALLWGLIFCVLVCVLPVIYIGAMVWRGKIGDIHMKERHERYRPLLLTVICAAITSLIFRFGGAPPIFTLIALMALVQIGLMTLITLSWQISMHAMSIAGVTVAAGMSFGWEIAFLLVPIVVMVVAARLQLKRHTPAQVLGGTLLGALAPMILVALF